MHFKNSPCFWAELQWVFAFVLKTSRGHSPFLPSPPRGLGIWQSLKTMLTNTNGLNSGNEKPLHNADAWVLSYEKVSKHLFAIVFLPKISSPLLPQEAFGPGLPGTVSCNTEQMLARSPFHRAAAIDLKSQLHVDDLVDTKRNFFSVRMWEWEMLSTGKNFIYFTVCKTI